MERKDRLSPEELNELTRTMHKLALKCTVILEQHGILKHKMTLEEIEAADLKTDQLTVDYMTGKIEVDEYRTELDKLPRLDLRQLAQELHFKG